MSYGPIVGMIIAVTFILTVGGTILLYPIATQLGAYLKVLTEERRLPRPSPTLSEPVLTALERIERRLGVLEERQEFSEELLRSRHQGLPTLQTRGSTTIVSGE